MNIWDIFDKIDSGVTNFIDVDVSFTAGDDSEPVMVSSAIGVAADYVKIGNVISKLAEQHEIILRCHVVFTIPDVDELFDKILWCPVVITNGQVHFLMTTCSTSDPDYTVYLRDVRLTIDNGNVVFKTEFH